MYNSFYEPFSSRWKRLRPLWTDMGLLHAEGPQSASPTAQPASSSSAPTATGAFRINATAISGVGFAEKDELERNKALIVANMRIRKMQTALEKSRQLYEQQLMAWEDELAHAVQRREEEESMGMRGRGRGRGSMYQDDGPFGLLGKGKGGAGMAVIQTKAGDRGSKFETSFGMAHKDLQFDDNTPLTSPDDEFITVLAQKSAFKAPLAEFRTLLLQFMTGYKQFHEKSLGTVWASVMANRNVTGANSGLSHQHLYMEVKTILSKSKKMSAGFVRLINRFIKQLCDVEKQALQDYIVSQRSEQLIHVEVQAEMQDPRVEAELKKLNVQKLALQRSFETADKLETEARVAVERASGELEQYKNAMYSVHLSIYKTFHSFYKHRWKWTERLRDPLRVIAGQELEGVKDHNAKEAYRACFRRYLMEVMEADAIALGHFTQYIVSDHLFGTDVGGKKAKKEKPTDKKKKKTEADPAPPDNPGDPEFSPFADALAQAIGAAVSEDAAAMGRKRSLASLLTLGESSSMPPVPDASPNGAKGKRASSVAGAPS